MIETAAQSRLHSLYHYQAYNLDWLTVTLTNNTIYFSSPAGFNDPWDCRVTYRPIPNSPIEVQRHVNAYIRWTRFHLPQIPVAEVEARAQFYRKNPESLNTGLLEIARAMEMTFRTHFRIYCLSPHNNSELMWAHYADKHRGVCLGFSLRNAVLSSALKVQYGKQYPLWDAASEEAEENVGPIIRKSSAWEYEDEYRLVAQEQIESPDTLTSLNGYVALPEDALTSIFVGCLVSAHDIQKIIDVVRASNRQVDVLVSRRARDRYEIVFERVFTPAA